jgi:hypothetical protein
MPTDLLVIAGLASEILERHGFVACGRRENGKTRVDFWSRGDGKPFRHDLTDENVTVDEVVAACLAHAKQPPAPVAQRKSQLS